MSEELKKVSKAKAYMDEILARILELENENESLRARNLKLVDAIDNANGLIARKVVEKAWPSTPAPDLVVLPKGVVEEALSLLKTDEHGDCHDKVIALLENGR